MANKWTYSFGDGVAQGNASMRELLGSKGANLAEMSALGLPVPSGFTIVTDACDFFLKSKKTFNSEIKGQILTSLEVLEKSTGRVFGCVQNPLFVSIRSGAAVSMPGMMDTVLNLGLNDEAVEALAQETNDPRFAYDCYRRFIQMYGEVVMGVDYSEFEDILESAKQTLQIEFDTDISANDWQKIIEQYKVLIKEETNSAFPQKATDQLFGAIASVFDSWNSARAKMYRTINNISQTNGTAVTVQAMVFGNRGEMSATGVAFTRNPSTGENEIFGEFLANAQGEDVVAGTRTPHGICATSSGPSLEKMMPDVFDQLQKTAGILEKHFTQMQDMEFTIEQGKLWMLQTRIGKCTARAALRIAVDMVQEGTKSIEEAVASIDASSLIQILHPTIADNTERDILATGLAASPGAATGKIVFNSKDAETFKAAGEDVILVRRETSPEDIHGMNAAQGILTQRGGMTSHAAVIARGMGKPCVSGASTMRINLEAQELNVMGRVLKKGDVITLDGGLGQVLVGAVKMEQPKLSGAFGILMRWADELRRMDVRSNAEMSKDAQLACSFGAQGIGLCRTEHMFFEGERIVAVREMILAEDEEGRRKALAKLLPMQRQDFSELFEIMQGRPVNIRLLDPPLHEFLPKSQVEMERVSNAMGVSLEKLERRAFDLKEVNPMLGLRGCRIAISYPEIVEMQSRAIFEAAVEATENSGRAPAIEIMVPLISLKAEYGFVHNTIVKIAKEVLADAGVELDYTIGTMIELPRAALRAGELAQKAEFFSFGTNDLTQTTFGISRDDSPQFLAKYQMNNLIEHDPFSQIDEKGVGDLMKIAMERGRACKPNLKFGACGEHAGDPSSIEFFENIGMDYISCSPYRVPIARLAAAQAALKNKSK